MEPIDNKGTVIAVLPFQIHGGTKTISPLIGGFTEDLTLNFSKFIGLSVISQYSTMGIKDLSDRNSIAQLGADYLICGSFRPLDAGFRIGVQLIRDRDSKVIFAGNHDQTLDTILNAQDSIVQQIVNVLKGKIDHDLLSYSYKKESVDLAVYENWLLGMNELKKGSLESDLVARAHFQAALKLDPSFARAHTGLSLSYFNEWSCQLWERWEISQKGAYDHALKALALDENDYVSLAVLGRVQLYMGNHDKAEHLFLKSLQMNPNDAENLVLIAHCMVWLGHIAKAQQLFDRARKLNPMQPEAFLPAGAYIHFEKGDFVKALELGEKVTDLTVWTDYAALIAAIHFHLSQFDRMEEYWKKYIEIFQRNINKGREASVQMAVDWHREVTPYRVSSRFEPFWDHMCGRAPKPFKARTETTKGFFVRVGEYWQLEYMGTPAFTRDCKGLHDIARLLEQSERPLHCTALMGSLLESGGVALADEQALKDFRKRIAALEADISDAQEMGDLNRAMALNEEYDALIEHLSQITGMSQKTRKSGSTLEKARTAITWRIRFAIKKIENVHPQLAKHLSRSIQTGTYCSYRPETPHEWTV